MSFTLQDFKDSKIQTKIQAVIMDKLGFEPIKNYHDLTTRQQKKFKDLQNEYLNSPPFKSEYGDWEDTLNGDFNDVTYEFLHGKKNYLHMVDNTITDKEMCFRNDEEKKYFEKTELENFERFVEWQTAKNSNKNEESVLV
jgi:hypothetical protein